MKKTSLKRGKDKGRGVKWMCVVLSLIGMSFIVFKSMGPSLQHPQSTTLSTMASLASSSQQLGSTELSVVATTATTGSQLLTPLTEVKNSSPQEVGRQEKTESSKAIHSRVNQPEYMPVVNTHIVIQESQNSHEYQSPRSSALAVVGKSATLPTMGTHVVAADVLSREVIAPPPPAPPATKSSMAVAVGGAGVGVGVGRKGGGGIGGERWIMGTIKDDGRGPYGTRWRAVKDMGLQDWLVYIRIQKTGSQTFWQTLQNSFNGQIWGRNTVVLIIVFFFFFSWQHKHIYIYI
jgi:hypothetical protein